MTDGKHVVLHRTSERGRYVTDTINGRSAVVVHLGPVWEIRIFDPQAGDIAFAHVRLLRVARATLEKVLDP